MHRWIFTAVVAACGLGAQPQPARELRAGAAASNITPPLGSPIVGGWDAPAATYIHDELHARALVLDNGTTRLAIVVSDNVGIPRNVFDAAKRLVKKKTGIPVSNMLMSATHTHSASSARSGDYTEKELSEYQRFLSSRIADAVVRAVHNLEPAEIGWGVGREPSQVFNRRWRMRPTSPELKNPFGGTDHVRMNPPVGHPDLVEPAGPTDPEIHFLSLRAAGGRPIALLANYSLHYVGGVPRGHISADYFGVFTRRVQALLRADDQDPPFVGILSNGTSGDINNIDFRGGTAPRKWKPYEKMNVVANQVASEVFRAMQTISYHKWVPLGIVQSEIPLGVRVPDAADVKWAEAVLSRAKTAPGTHVREEIYARRTLDMKELSPTVPVVLQALRVGDLGIAAIPAEVFVEIGLEIRKRSPFPQTFTISLANGWYGYLPTAEQHKLGGYETWRGTNRLEVQAASRIVDTLAKMMGELRSLP
ncbi:MAG TPA: hypothetical protein VES20_01265 [Bryobacteraceae bacterium]|nr:hypothetical protein [Bryobacteraceae bacterium]